MIDFPASPSNGQVFTSGAQSWTFDGTKWVAAGNAVMPPLATGDNRIINGDMRIDQRNAAASGTAIGVYTVDRWMYQATQAAKGTWIRNITSSVGVAATGCGYNLGFSSSSAYAVAVGDHFEFRQPVEADMISDFAWGTSGAQPVTLSFWVNSSLTGTFGGSVSNGTNTRSYPFTYSISAANTWTKIVVNIPADTGGTWVLAGNAAGLYLFFGLGMGSTYSGPPGAWASADYRSANGAVSVVGTNAAGFFLTGVKLEIGSVATPFNRQSLAKSLADCQRYYQQVTPTFRLNGVAGGSYNTTVTWLQMRASPIATLVTAGTRSNANTIALSSASPNSGYFGFAATAAGDTYAIRDVWSLDAEL